MSEDGAAQGCKKEMYTKKEIVVTSVPPCRGSGTLYQRDICFEQVYSDARGLRNQQQQSH